MLQLRHPEASDDPRETEDTPLNPVRELRVRRSSSNGAEEESIVDYVARHKIDDDSRVSALL